jgi:3-dehydroquinate dehydratase II
MAELLVLNGPNLNVLGDREPQYYGTTTMAEINARLAHQAQTAGHRLQSFQSNAEHALIDRVQQAATEGVAFIVLNPAGLTSTSVALRDALTGTRIPFIEVHLSNIHAREPFRRQSYFSDIALGVISGLGAQGYELALAAAVKHLEKSKKS